MTFTDFSMLRFIFTKWKNIYNIIFTKLWCNLFLHTPVPVGISMFSAQDMTSCARPPRGSLGHDLSFFLANFTGSRGFWMSQSPSRQWSKTVILGKNQLTLQDDNMTSYDVICCHHDANVHGATTFWQGWSWAHACTTLRKNKQND